jgi:diadenosine tetraphosphate (Ap4A) HIT family hydrolase
VAEEPSNFVRRLPIGERMPADEVVADPLFPFEGEIRTRPLEAPTLPEPTRFGESAADCWSCTDSGDVPAHLIWQDERWRVLVDPEPHGLPMVAVLMPRAHHDLEDLPPDLAAELGIMIQRVAWAIGRLDGIGRVHVNRWGDGGFHFHVWFLARPRGMRQLRGAMIAIWDELLPKVPADEWAASRHAVAEALSEGGGHSLA